MPTPIPYWWQQPDPNLPPPADLNDPFNTSLVPAGAPAVGGPGSYPSISPSPTPQTPDQWGPGTGVVPMPGSYPSPSPTGTPPDLLVPGAPNDQFQLPTGDTTGPQYAGDPSGTGLVPGQLPFQPGITDPSGAGLADPNLNYVQAPDGGYYVYDGNWQFQGHVPTITPGQPVTGMPEAPTQGGHPAWTQNPPGVNLTPQDRFRMGQDVDPRSGMGSPGNYNPYGPGGSPGTLGIVSPASPAGGGSFFGGRYNPMLDLAGSTFNLGAAGGDIAGLGGKLAWHMAQPMFGGRTLAQVARQNPELLPGLTSMATANPEGSPAQQTGGGHVGVSAT